MSIEQISLYIPKEIEVGLANGSLQRFGGVVRDNAGHVVAHLKEVPGLKSTGQTLKSAAKLVTNNPLATAVAGAAVGIGATVVAVAIANKHRSSPKRLENNFKKSFEKYLFSAQASNIGLKDVRRLIDDLDALEEISQGGEYCVDGDRNLWDLLLGSISEYTLKFADANHVTLSNDLYRTRQLEEGRETRINVLEVRPYLEVQKRILGG